MEPRRISVLLDPRVPSEARAIEAYERICSGLPARARATLLREIMIEGVITAAGMKEQPRRGRPRAPTPEQAAAIRLDALPAVPAITAQSRPAAEAPQPAPTPKAAKIVRLQTTSAPQPGKSQSGRQEDDQSDGGPLQTDDENADPSRGMMW
ncbi:hypothetical protein [Acidiphilium sp. C61]|uniref:hypothetical protein n=1 Tax=Acidiphilium sp. C61 TaxID=1671485 RepID=UPI00157B6DC0|nr:hypothetical protein [Acidiphilium sp. C61]